MLLGGLAGTALMLGVGAIMVSNAPPAGPGQEATWPAGETMSLNRIPGERNSVDPTATCTVTPEGQPAEPNHWFTIGRPSFPDFTGAATVTCDQEVALLAGTPRVVAEYTRGPLIAVPLFITGLGILFFFPRFTLGWARLSTSGWLRKLLRIPPSR
jgi:hypothetical protein